MKKNFLYSTFPCLLTVSGLMLSPVAQSHEKTPYIGLKAGYQFSQDDAYHHEAQDPSAGVLGVFAGYQFTPQWALEAGYQYHDTLHASATSVDVNTSLFEAAVRYDWYWQENASVYGRLGMGYWDMDKSAPGFNPSATGFSPLGEIGLAYQFTPELTGSMGYQYIDDIGDETTLYYDSHSVVWSLSYAFHSEEPSIIEPVTIRPVEPAVMKTWVADSATCQFEFDRFTLSELCQAFLLEPSRVLAQHPQARANVVGHTDSVGSEKYNQVLSERRARAVAQFLEQQGVKSNQLHVEGKGETHPLTSNTTREGRAANRRIEINIAPFQYEKNQNESSQ